VSKKFGEDNLLKLVDILDDELFAIWCPVNNLRILGSLHKTSIYIENIEGFSNKASDFNSFALALINI
jgi:hypothetical protein